jgi:hypothetical protein
MIAARRSSGGARRDFVPADCRSSMSFCPLPSERASERQRWSDRYSEAIASPEGDRLVKEGRSLHHQSTIDVSSDQVRQRTLALGKNASR